MVSEECSLQQPENQRKSDPRIRPGSDYSATAHSRTLRCLGLCLLTFSSFLTQCASAEEKQAPVGLGLLDALIEYHRTTGTQIDGPRCPMYPSCAGFAHRAIRQEGWKGFFLTLERLFFREGGDLSTRYPVAPRFLSEDPRYFDPVEASLGERPRLADPIYLSH